MIELRALKDLAELRSCVELQNATWGEGYSEVAPTSVLQVSQKTGGFLGGAFVGDTLVGFIYSLFANFEDTICHWSHMLAVHSSARGEGLGRRLKLFQREALLTRGINTVFWTFDPMVAQNAPLNLNRLGANILTYVPNMYGADTGSLLHVGGETDRFIVRWDLESQRTHRAVEGGLRFNSKQAPKKDCLIARPGPGSVSKEMPSGDEVFIEIPGELTDSTEEDVDLVQWRATVRNAFMKYLRRGYAVQNLYRGTNTCYYFLTRS